LLALFLLMTVAALLVGGMVALAAALGVDATSAVFQALSQQIIQLPRSAVLLVAVVMLYNRGPLASRAARYGLIGFGGLLLLTVLGTGFQIVVQAVVVGNSGLDRIGFLHLRFHHFRSHGRVLRILIGGDPGQANRRRSCPGVLATHAATCGRVVSIGTGMPALETLCGGSKAY
jgi:hypothetical protein